MSLVPRPIAACAVALLALGPLPGAAQPETTEPRVHLACAGHGVEMPCLGDTPDAPSAPAWQETLRRAYGAPTPTMAYDRAPFRTAIECSDARAELRGEKATSGQVDVQLVSEAAQWVMRKTASLGGDRYEAQSDASTWVWVRDDSVALSVNGRMLPSCKAAGDAQPGEGAGPKG